MVTFQSLEAFVAYGQLYDLWWDPRGPSALEKSELQPEACSSGKSFLDQSNAKLNSSLEEAAAETDIRKASEKTEAKISVEPDPFPKSNGAPEETASPAKSALSMEREVKLEACRVLLSAEHAAVQSLQRDISRVQQTLTDMICQHQKNNFHQSATNGQNEEIETPSGQAWSQDQVNEQISLPDLTKQLTEANKKLAEFPENIKASRFPDVLECCLVLLHIDSQDHESVISEIQQQSLDLLKKYRGTHICKDACEKFFS